MKTLGDWLRWLETLSPREIDLGLERVRAVLGRLALPRPAQVIHVAGTNGKGSSAAMLDVLLRKSGLRCGCYTSPHLVRYNERIRVDGASATDGEIVSAFEAVETVRDGIPLTYFEYGTLAALVVFARAGVEAQVLEIGMGGRLDAVNAVDPDAALITNVTLDHCEWLGDDVETIAREKAGVMRRGIPVIFGAEPAPRAISDEAARVGAELRLAGRDFSWQSCPGDEHWDWEGHGMRLAGLSRPGLHGRFQLRNAAAVLAVLEAACPSVLNGDLVNSALRDVSVPGRFQWVERGRRWLLDVAHNPDAAVALGQSLEDLGRGAPRTAVVGVLRDKDADGIIAPLLCCIDRWIAVEADSPRALEARSLAERIAAASNRPCLIQPDIATAMAYLGEALPTSENVLVTGSFFTVGPALAWLEQD